MIHALKYTWPKSFLRSSEEWDLNKIFHENLQEISFFEKSLLILFRRSFEDFKKIFKFFIQKILKKFLPKIFLRSSVQIFLRSLVDLLVHEQIHIFVMDSLKIFIWDLGPKYEKVFWEKISQVEPVSLKYFVGKNHR